MKMGRWRWNDWLWQNAWKIYNREQCVYLKIFFFIYKSFIWFIFFSFNSLVFAFLHMHSFVWPPSGRSRLSGQVNWRPNKGLIMIYLVLDQCFPMRQIQTLMMTWSCPMLPPMMNQAVLESGKISLMPRKSFSQSFDIFWHQRFPEKQKKGWLLLEKVFLVTCGWQITKNTMEHQHHYLVTITRPLGTQKGE